MASADKRCCVTGCNETRDTNQVLHRFPNPDKERERFNTWLYAIGGDVIGLENNYIFKNRRVCHQHFEQKYHCRNNRLSNIAVPTLNLPGPLSLKKHTLLDRRPMCEIQNLSTKPTGNQDEHLASTSSLYMNLEKESIGCLQTDMPINPPLVCLHGENQNLDPLAMDIKEKQVSEAAKQVLSSEAMPLSDNIKESSNPLIMESETTQVSETAKKSLSSDPITLGDKVKESSRKTAKTGKKYTKHLFMTTAERDLHQKIISIKVKLCKLKSKVKKQTEEIKAAKKLAFDPSVIKLLENFSYAAKLLIFMQFRETKKKQKGRRFTLQEKILALSILKQSAKAYRFLRKIFILPAPQTLVKLIQMSNLRPGINKKIFRQLQKTAAKMSKEDKLCVLLFDEVSLKAHLSFKEKQDKITGFVDNGLERSPEFADHAQVFMIRGLIKNYKQAISYTFSRSATKGPELSVQIKSIISELQKAGLYVVATVCDQGSNNRQALNLLLNETRGIYLRKGESPKDNVILINNEEIVCLYDPPHLIKGMRNNLLTKNLKYEKDGVTKTAKWSHLEELQKENPGYKGIRLMPKLTDQHIKPEKINKMKVKFATQIFSRTIASNMGYLAGKGILPEECKDTADLLLFMDDIFDSVNGSFKKNKHAKPLLGPATPNSVHQKTWTKSIKIFESMKFVNKLGKEETVPTVTNWIWTLRGIQILLKNLQTNYGITSVWMRHLNQDPLENFFGAIRSQGCRNNNPTCEQFESSFATLLINNINTVQSRGKNCESDYCDALHALVVDDNSQEDEPSTTCIDMDVEKLFSINLIPLSEKENDPRVIGPLQYISGYFLKKLKNVFKNCETCKGCLSTENIVDYINYREYAGRRWLCYPSLELIELISNIQDICHVILKDYTYKNNIKEILKTSVIILTDFNFIRCEIHKQKNIDTLLNVMIKVFMHNYCKNINKILAGKRQVDDDEDVMQMKAKKFYTTCFKRNK